MTGFGREILESGEGGGEDGEFLDLRRADFVRGMGHGAAEELPATAGVEVVAFEEEKLETAAPSGRQTKRDSSEVPRRVER